MIEHAQTGADIRLAREQLDLSQNDMALILDIERQTLTKWENGLGRPSKPVLRIVNWLLQGWRPPEWPAPGTRGSFRNGGHRDEH